MKRLAVFFLACALLLSLTLAVPAATFTPTYQSKLLAQLNMSPREYFDQDFQGPLLGVLWLDLAANDPSGSTWASPFALDIEKSLYVGLGGDNTAYAAYCFFGVYDVYTWQGDTITRIEQHLSPEDTLALMNGLEKMEEVPFSYFLGIFQGLTGGK